MFTKYPPRHSIFTCARKVLAKKSPLKGYALIMKKLLSSALTCAIAGSLLVAPAAHAEDEIEILVRTSESVRGTYDPTTNRWTCTTSGDYTSLKDNSYTRLTSMGPCTHPEYTTLLNTVFEHLEETIDQVGDLTNDVKDLENKLQASENEVDHLHKNLTNSRNELDATKRENRKLSNALEGSEQEVENLHKNLKIARQDLDATKQKNRKLNAEIDQAKKNLEELKEQQLLTEEELSQAKAKLAEAEAKVKALSDRVTQLEAEVKDLKARNAELQKKNDDLTAEIDSLNDENDSLNNGLNTSIGLNIFFGVISAIAAIIGIGHFLKPVFEKFFHRR